MKDKERWQMKLRKEAIEIKGVRESSENDGGRQNRNEDKSGDREDAQLTLG